MKKFKNILVVFLVILSMYSLSAQSVTSIFDTCGFYDGIVIRSSYGYVVNGFRPTSMHQSPFDMSVRFGGFFAKKYSSAVFSGYVLPEISRDITRDTFGEFYSDTTRFLVRRFVPIHATLDFTYVPNDKSHISMGMTRTFAGLNSISRLTLDNQMDYEVSRWVEQEALGVTYIANGFGGGAYYEPYSKNHLIQIGYMNDNVGISASYSSKVSSVNIKFSNSFVSGCGFIDNHKKIAWHIDGEVIPAWKVHIFSNGSTGNGMLRSCTFGSYIIINNNIMNECSIGAFYDLGGTHRNFALQTRIKIPLTN